MNSFLDSDIIHYVKIGIISLIAFIVLAVAMYFYYLPDNNISLKKTVLEYQEDIKIVDLIESVGDIKVEEKNKISSNTLNFEKYEITFDELDTKKLGKQTINAKFSDDTIKTIKFFIYVKDTKKPKIELLVKDGHDIELEKVRKMDFLSLFSVSDNYTSSSKIKVSTYVKEENYSYNDTITLTIEAEDSNKNFSNKKLKLHILDKEKPKKEEKKDDLNFNNNPSKQENQSNPIISSRPEPQIPKPSPSINKPKPVGKKFLFSDGYTIETAPAACQNELLSSNSSGKCLPIKQDGIYIGMELIFD